MKDEDLVAIQHQITAEVKAGCLLASTCSARDHGTNISQPVINLKRDRSPGQFYHHLRKCPLAMVIRSVVLIKIGGAAKPLI